MRRLSVFNNVSADGYFCDAQGSLAWAKQHADREWKGFVEGNAGSGGTLIFGRVTYELMASYWPSPMAKKHDPVTAEGMNTAAKIVFSRTLKKASWQNTTLFGGRLIEELKALKTQTGSDLVILGSGTLVAQLAKAGLVDQFQLVVNPIVLGRGRTLFEGLEAPIELERTSTRAFKNGNVVITYAPK